MNTSTIIFISIGVLFILFLFFLYFKRIAKRKKVEMGLAEGPATQMELENDPELRQTYIDFKELMFSTLSLKYENIKVIASGGMGIIVTAIDKKDKKKVAIKTISPKLHKHPKAIKFFFQECQAIQKMNHPNIVRIYDSADEGFLYYVMEFLEGETLEEKINREGVLPVSQIVRIGTQVARALQHCHSNGIVHRDIKPSNIFITKNDICKIIDFGVVKMLDAETHETGAIGSPHYAAPEQLQAGKISGKSDVYSLGVCLYKMASGQYPYSVNDLVTKVFEKPKNLKDICPSVSDELIEIINECIAIDPSQRCEATKLWAKLKKINIGE